MAWQILERVRDRKRRASIPGIRIASHYVSWTVALDDKLGNPDMVDLLWDCEAQLFAIRAGGSFVVVRNKKMQGGSACSRAVAREVGIVKSFSDIASEVEPGLWAIKVVLPTIATEEESDDQLAESDASGAVGL